MANINIWKYMRLQFSLELSPETFKNHTDLCKWFCSIPSGGTLEFLALSRSSDVSLLTAVPLLVLRRTLNARFNLLKERLLTEERSKFLTAKKTGRREALYKLPQLQHALTCLSLAPANPSSLLERLVLTCRMALQKSGAVNLINLCIYSVIGKPAKF
ncbi:hypothetical protein ILYODFUR_001283 [Ilyodon furcidens]|uniref:Uncharacterized protein n=1 Tax=Ilyodon furcidens TaxID=33524 RepID=A0ABV0T4C4_9TELE